MTSSTTRRTSDALLADMMLLHPKLIDLSLGRVERLLAKLGHPEKKLPPVVHVAGTNGKGSVTAYLRAFAEAAGKRVHVYTSPHLVRFHERIALSGDDGKSRPIDEDSLVDVLMRVHAVNDGDNITQFEITTAAAFLAFSERPADVLLLEVGLGGRLDATNVIAEPALTIITSISLDHAEKLGPTLGKIAFEKAGILKRGVPGIISQQSDEVLAVLEARARAVGAPLTVWGRDYDAYEQAGRLIVQEDARCAGVGEGVEESCVAEDDGAGGVGEHVCEAFGRVGRVEGHIRAARLEHGDDGNDHLGAPRSTQRHKNVGANTNAAATAVPALTI